MAIPVMNFPILGFEQTNPALIGAAQGTRTVSDLLANQQVQMRNKILQQYGQPMAEEALKQSQYQTQIEAPKAQYAPQMTLSDLLAKQEETRRTQEAIKQMQLTSKYYPQQQEMELAQKRFGLQNPLLSLGGTAGQLGAVSYMQQHPEIYGNETPTGGVPGTEEAPTSMADILQKSIGSAEEQKNARAKYYEKMTQSMDYRTLPIDQKSAVIAQASGMGYDPNEASTLFMQGNTVRDLATKAGFDPENMPDPIYPATRTDIARINLRRSAIQELNYLNPLITDALAPYSRRILDYSPSQVADALKGTNTDAQAKALAAKAVIPELSALRLRAMGGQVGIEAIREVTDASMANIKTFQSLVSPEVYKQANTYIDQWISSAVDRANKVIIRGLSQQEEARKREEGLTENIPNQLGMGSQGAITPTSENDPLGIR